MPDSVYRRSFLANEDWHVTQQNFSLNIMKSQVKYKEALKAIAASEDQNQLTPD
jgi:hypothetical protein